MRWLSLLVLVACSTPRERIAAPAPTTTAPSAPAAAQTAISGRVVDDLGLPVADASVRIGERTVISTSDGSFAFPGVTAPALITAERGGLAGVHHVADATPQLVVVVPSSDLEVRVVADDGTPIAGARVIAAVNTQTADILERTTGSDGIAVLRCPPNSVITAEAAGFTWTSQRRTTDPEQPTPSQLTLRLVRGAALRGRVVDDRGAAVANAKLSVQPEGGWVRDFAADASGSFTIPALPAGGHAVLVYAPPQRTSQLVRTDGVTAAELTLVVPHSAVIEGRVVDAANHPVANARIDDATTSDAQGRFRKRVVPGTHELIARDRDRSSERVEVDVVDRAEVTLVLGAPLPRIAGRVVDTAGVAVANAYVTDNEYRTAYADVYGAFSITVDKPGAQLLRVSRGDVADELTAHTGDDNELVVPTYATITGRIIVEGEPAPVFALSIDSTTTIASGMTRAVFDRDGRFVMRGLPVGALDVTFAGPHFATFTRQVTTEPGRTADLGTLDAARGRILRGTVTDPRGRPVANARVVVDPRRADARANRALERIARQASTTTDARGRFEIVGLPPAKQHTIVAFTDDATSRERTVAPTATTADLRLVASGRLAGRITTDRMAEIIIAGPEYTHRLFTDLAGRFSLAPLVPGTYSITASTRGSSTHEVRITAGRVHHVEVALPPPGFGVRFQLANCDGVTLELASGSAYGHCASGSLRFSDVPAGAHKLCRPSGTCVSVDVKPLAVQTLSVTLPD